MNDNLKIRENCWKLKKKKSEGVALDSRQLTIHRCVCVVFDVINYRRLYGFTGTARTHTHGYNWSELARNIPLQLRGFLTLH